MDATFSRADAEQAHPASERTARDVVRTVHELQLVDAAVELNVKQRTVANWRAKGTGPAAAVHVAVNRVMYPRWAVEEFRQRRILAAAERLVEQRERMRRVRALRRQKKTDAPVAAKE